MSKKTCLSKSFISLFATQFLGAFNDNFFKVLISLLVVGGNVPQEKQSLYLSLAGAMLVLPYILFSSYAGFLADRFRKSTVMKYMKGLEVLVMLFGFWSVLIGNTNALFVVLFFMGLQSALFSPAKYGILPEMLSHDQLSKGNGYLQFGTYGAILTGSALSGFALTLAGENLLLPASILVIVAGVGLLTSLGIEPSPIARVDAVFNYNPFKEVTKSLLSIWRNRPLFLTVLAISYFWFLGALFQLNIFLYAEELGIVSHATKSLLITVLGIGIGLGSIVAGKVSEGKVEIGLVPLGSVGLSFFSFFLAWISEAWCVYLGLFFLGLSGGFFIVPLNAFLQERSPASERGAYIAAGNFLAMAGVILSSVFLWFATNVFNLKPSELFLASGIFSAISAIYILTLLPEAFVRCVNWLLTHSIYRVRVVDSEHLPKQGGALIVCNHVSFIDASLLLASIERPVRFLMYRPIYESRIINPLARRMKAIPIASGDGRKGIEKSLEYARELIEEGEIVGIFAEGAITRTGGMLPFKSGFETIMKGSTAPIIPAHIDRLWGSIFSFRRGKAFFKIPREIPYPVTVSFGEPLDSSANANEVRSAVECLSAKAFALRPGLNSTLAESFILQTKKSPFRKALRGNKKLFRYLHLSGRALSISSALVRNSVPEANLFLSVANRFEAALAHIAGVLSGKKILHLARNAPCKELAATLSGTIIIKTFSEASSLQSDESLPWIKLNSLGGSIESALWQFAILLIPIQLWRRFFANSRHITPNSVAYLLSTTQSIENPKLVKLEHKNVLANIEGLTEVFDIESHDVFAGILPLSYSLAVGPAFWLPLLRGAAISYPAIDTEFNLDWLSKEEITVLIATPMLADRLLNETKESKNLASLPRKLALRRAFVGGDVVRENLLREFHEKIGVRLDEGYGCAEIGAVGLINLRDFGEGKAAQKGTKVGSAGVPVPGLAVRIVSSQGMVELPHGTVGELQFYGVCISTSYALIESNSDVDVLNEQGWFESKDFGVRDEDGFVRVLGPWYRTLLVDNTRYDLRDLESEICDLLNQNNFPGFALSTSDQKANLILYIQEGSINSVREHIKSAPLSDPWNRCNIELLPIPKDQVGEHGILSYRTFL